MPIAADIYYHLYQGGSGESPPIILIHGAGGTYLHWPAEIRRLSDYRVFAIDLPGHGKSEGRGQQTIEAYARNILSWLKAVGLHRAIFIGHSMGAAIALTLAHNHSDHVLGLGLVGAGARLRVAPVILENSANPQSSPRLLRSSFHGLSAKKQIPAWWNWLPNVWSRHAHLYCTATSWPATPLILPRLSQRFAYLPW